MLNKYRHRTNSSSVVPSCPTMFPPAVMAPPTAPTRKRTHLKPSQVAVLQESFVTNPLPDASIRSRLARELGVTERTIQIWFQNRRAKARKLDAISSNCPGGSGKIPSLMPNVRTGWIEPPQRNNNNNNTPQRYQATFRTMMTPERFEEMQQQQLQQQQQQQQQQHQEEMSHHHQQETNNNSNASWQQQRRRPRSYSKPETACVQLLQEEENDAIPRAMSEGTDRMIPKQGPNSEISFPVAALRVGSWARFAGLHDQQWDLVCYAHQRQLIWQIQDDGHQFRIQIDFNAIRQLVLTSEVQEDMTMADQLQVHLDHAGDLTFSMWRAGIDHDWIRCGDFSENKQATYQAVHVLQGNHDMLRQALLQLFSQSPDMFSKCTMAMPEVPPLDLCRDFTLSPSATPEPAMTTAAVAAYAVAATATTAAPTTSNSGAPHWMLQETTPSTTITTSSYLPKSIDESAWLHQQQQQPWDNSWHMLQQQQQQPHQQQHHHHHHHHQSLMDVNFL